MAVENVSPAAGQLVGTRNVERTVEQLDQEMKTFVSALSKLTDLLNTHTDSRTGIGFSLLSANPRQVRNPVFAFS